MDGLGVGESACLAEIAELIEFAGEYSDSAVDPNAVPGNDAEGRAAA
jgi:hypothetical protein